MAIKKETKTVKNTVKDSKSQPNKAIKKQPVKTTEKNASSKTKQIVNNKIQSFDFDLAGNMNDSPIFDLFIFRELFMELRKNLDDLSAKKDKSEKDYAIYDDAVYNITANAVTDAGAQDFLGYCYKKGFYDFCLMNYEKYMKWTILAAANGNAFSLSKLQIFLATATDPLLGIDRISYVKDFLDLTDENFVIFLSRMLCQEMVQLLNIDPEALIKIPEAYEEQTEELSKIFDKAKLEAMENVKITLTGIIKELQKKIDEDLRQKELSRERQLKKQIAEQKKVIEELSEDEIKEDESSTKASKTPEKKGNAFKKNMEIKKKFRW